MADLNYKTTFITREATVARIEDLKVEIAMLDRSKDNLTILMHKLIEDISYFDEVDRAMEQAVK